MIQSSEIRKCVNCGAPILDAEFLVSAGYTNPAKYCEKCRREMREHRKEGVTNRSLLQEWKGVMVDDFYGEFQKEAGKYRIYAVGGRRFSDGGAGSSYAGVSYDQRILIYVQSDLIQNESIQGLIDIRKMVKEYEKDGSKRLSEYYVFEKSAETEIKLYLTYLKRWWKTTLKGYGQDRDFTQRIISPDDIHSPVIETLFSVKSSARSGRFGLRYEYVLIEGEYQIEDDGIA